MMVMPQTIEAINHEGSESTNYRNREQIDKPGANLQHVMQELSEYELIPGGLGRRYDFC